MTTIAQVELWGTIIGAVSLANENSDAAFQYDPDFLNSGIELSPLMMPLSQKVYTFSLPQNTFHGLPGLLSDSLPDKFGNTLIDAWLATQGRSPQSFNAVERLCYMGRRGMGALEFVPSLGPKQEKSKKVDVANLVTLASEILNQRNNLKTTFRKREDALSDILRVGTSAGGARAKAVIVWNRKTHEVRSGQIESGDGFENWLIKFDGVSGNKDKELEDPKGYGAIEYAYSLMAQEAGIEMSECRLLEENGRQHFMTRRFDRLENGQKLHMQSLAAIAHFDYHNPGAYSYEQAFLVMRQLKLPIRFNEQLFRRMVFNILGRNQDDHVKNIAFLMDREGQWSLSPAFDVTYSYNPQGQWTSRHQMTLNGKRENFTLEDFLTVAKTALLKRGRAETVIEEVRSVMTKWNHYAEKASVSEPFKEKIQKALILRIQK
ncbi:MAG: type II toxin-antitoxin system HipA family toxin [Deltaproteobacteria bacterium]|nr:MAG: type II toxin-antitoxin system HipA family toxin [Deltaproteobacteria bacterium]